MHSELHSIHSTVPNVSQSLRRAELKHHLPRYNCPIPYTHIHSSKRYGGIPGSRINARIARILQCNTPILPYRPSATGRVNNLRGVEDIRRRRWLRSLVRRRCEIFTFTMFVGVKWKNSLASESGLRGPGNEVWARSLGGRRESFEIACPRNGATPRKSV